MSTEQDFKTYLAEKYDISSAPEKEALGKLLANVMICFDSNYSDQTQKDNLDKAALRLGLAMKKAEEAQHIIDGEEISMLRLGKEYLNISDDLEQLILKLKQMQKMCASGHKKMKSARKDNTAVQSAVGFIHEYWVGTLQRKFTHNMHRQKSGAKIKAEPISQASEFAYDIIKHCAPAGRKDEEITSGLQTALRNIL